MSVRIRQGETVELFSEHDGKGDSKMLYGETISATVCQELSTLSRDVSSVTIER